MLGSFEKENVWKEEYKKYETWIHRIYQKFF